MEYYAVLKWLVRTGLYGAAAVSVALSPVALFVGMASADKPNGSNIIVGLLIMAAPFYIAPLLIGTAIWVDFHPRYYPHAMALVCCIAAGGGYLEYRITHQARRAPPQLAEGHDFRAHGPSFYDPIQSERWTALFQSRFPVGSSATALENALHDQHFALGKLNVGPDAGPYADYSWGEEACYYDLLVRWNASPTGLIVSIKGSSNLVICNSAK